MKRCCSEIANTQGMGWLAAALLIGITASLLVLFPAVRFAGQSSGPSEVTFSKDVAPIVFKHCVYCHRPGQMAPFSLLTYTSARPWARAIKEQVQRHRMPPWYADGDLLLNSHRLDPMSIRTIVDWVDGGARLGDPADTPPPPRFAEGWQIGVPDLLLTPEPYTIPASGPMRVVTLSMDHEFPEDTWIQAIEVRPGIREAVHQALVINGDDDEPSGSLHLYSPGLDATIFRDGYARLVPAHTKLKLQVHYMSLGKEIVDRSIVAIKLATEPVHTQVHTSEASPGRLTAPAVSNPRGSDNRFPLSVDARMYALRVDLPVPGKTLTATLVLPDKSRKTLITLRGWPDQWQYTYVFANPEEIPKGAFIEYDGDFERHPLEPNGVSFDWGERNTRNQDDVRPIHLPGDRIFTVGRQAGRE